MTRPPLEPDPTSIHASVADERRPLSTARDGSTPAAASFRWVPIRSLSARHRPRILHHLLALDESDRYLRFGSVATDAQIAHYVDLIDFDGDEAFGIFNRKLELLAMAHLAHERTRSIERTTSGVAHGATSAEFGVSVLTHARGRGYGSRLFDRAVLHARNRSVRRLVIHALSQNKAMLNIARNAGAKVVRDGSESQAELELPPHDVRTQMEQFMEEAVGEIDFRFKAQAHAVGDMLSTMSGVGTLVMPGKGRPADDSENETGRQPTDLKADR